MSCSNNHGDTFLENYNLELATSSTNELIICLIDYHKFINNTFVKNKNYNVSLYTVETFIAGDEIPPNLTADQLKEIKESFLIAFWPINILGFIHLPLSLFTFKLLSNSANNNFKFCFFNSFAPVVWS